MMQANKGILRKGDLDEGQTNIGQKIILHSTEQM